MAEQIECLESEEIEIATEAPEEETYSENHDEENEEVVYIIIFAVTTNIQ